MYPFRGYTARAVDYFLLFPQNRHMAKKRVEQRADTTFKFRCRQKDMSDFKKAAEREGFGGNVSAWLLWHLRRVSLVQKK